ncbi:heparinase II/III-family protein [uncultured Psychrobacter sp.]|uniref:heparinase II/III family protein n=1 Tax=uncultured Psychrobacter sp. TaxID=259303 RepID=UPI003459EDAB
MEKQIDLDDLTLISESAKVETNYDGFRVKVSISIDFEQVECACYLYLDNKVFSKSGYRNNRKHVFYFKGSKENNASITVFFRDKKNSEIKKKKSFPITIENDFMYGLSENSLDSITLTDCEITNAKTDIIKKYESKGFQPRSDNTPYKLTFPIGWLDDPFKDRNWMFQLHAWRMLDGYLSRGNTKDLNYASKVINDWVAFEKTHKDKWLWYDMSTGLRALKICFYLKKCSDMGIDHKIKSLDYLLHEHLRHLSNPRELNTGNHGLFQLHGLKSLTYLLNNYSKGAYNVEKKKIYANEQMAELIASQLGSYGVHTEHSPDYHFFAHRKITKMIKTIWWSDLGKETLDFLELGQYARSWLVFPNDTCVPVGDSATSKPKSNLAPLEKWPHHTKSGNYIGAQVDGYAVIRSIKEVPLEKSSFLFFQGSFYSLAHKHSDDLSFILQEDGVDLLIDSGKYSYQRDKYRKYFLSTRAHNTVEIDGKSTSRSKENAYGNAILSQPQCIDDFWILKSRAEHKENKYVHERTIVYKPGVDLYVIDTIINKKISLPRKVSQWWHFDTDTEVFIGENKVIVSNSKGKSMKITSESSDKAVNYYYYKGYDSGSSLIGWISKSYLKYEPTSTIRISTILKKRSIILTRFKLDKDFSEEPILNLVNNKVVAKFPKLQKNIDN